MSARILMSVALFFAAAAAQAADLASAYAGQEARSIKALSADDVDALLTGQGMGFAKAAELNGYPGPAHVLAMADQLQLSPQQLSQTRAIEESMRTKAKALGAELVQAEQELDTLFASKHVDAQSLGISLARIGDLQANLRKAHLEAHLAEAALLSPDQTARYSELRGYGHSHSPDHQP